VLEGADANQLNLAEALKHNPSVLHMAAHVLFPSNQTGLGMVALALQPDNQIELVSATEIASMRAKLGLVVVDGCSSGHGAVLPGAGLMGMTRAWLVAGARAVIATRWPAGDQDTGELFYSLYRLYFSQRSHAPISFGRLLREAQLAELHAGGPHAAPSYWAKYFCVETN
jgi:CHAT domain-containing protein